MKPTASTIRSSTSTLSTPTSSGDGVALVRPSLLACEGGAGHGGASQSGEVSAVGIVVEVPKSAEPMWAGRRVIWPMKPSCGVCERCRGGLSHHCDEALPGASMAELLAGPVRVPVHDLMALPPEMTDETAALAGLVARACHGLRGVPLSGKGFATVIGAEAWALVLAKLMSTRVLGTRLLSEDPEVLRVAERWSLRHRTNAEAGRRGDQDVVVVARDRPADAALAVQLLKPRGLLLVQHRALGAGHPPASAPWPGEVIEAISAKELMIQGVCGPTRGALAEGVAALRSGAIEAPGLIGARIEASNWPAQSRPRTPLWTLVRCG
jgi:threonine dehydrogenase-like Zn-dependent dehydrogenase